MDKTEKQHALKDRPSNRTLPPGEGKRSHLHIRCDQKDKALWVKSAQAEGLKLAEWVNKTLNNNINSKCVDK
jgi:hypothetical protein